jgi:hypothetical protein
MLASTSLVRRKYDSRAALLNERAPPSVHSPLDSFHEPKESLHMNYWKPIALCAIAGLVVSVGTQVSSAAGVCHDQPNMAAALGGLKAARASLDKAEHNKGGWRVAAIEATNKAIAETDRGCAFADTH